MEHTNNTIRNLILAWRNLWRNPGRTAALIAAIAIGLWAGVMTVGLVNGMYEQRIDYVIRSDLGHLQIHHPDFLAERDLELGLPEVGKVKHYLEGADGVEGFSERTYADGMFRSARNSSGVRIHGIVPETETKVTNLGEMVVAGVMPDPAAPVRNPMLLGQVLAEEHGVDLGHRVVLTFEDLSGEILSASFTVTGFYKSRSKDMDKMNLYVLSEDLRRLLGREDLAHEVVVRLEDPATTISFTGVMQAQFPDLSVQSWDQLSPEIKMMIDYGGVSLVLIMVIIMLALSFGILNTMLMSLFERKREFGMLISIGMSRSRVFWMMMSESVVLTLVGSAIGMGLAFLAISYYSVHGLSLAAFAEGLAKIGWDSLVFPFVTIGDFATISVIVIGMTLLSSLYPALKAFRIHPLEASKDL
jgi:ABC-type lipoprotein release transport system permease subunit